MGYQNFKDIISAIIEEEEEFHKFVDGLAVKLEDPSSQKALESLKKMFQKEWSAVKKFQEEKFEDMEFMKEVPEDKLEKLAQFNDNAPKFDMNAKNSPQELFNDIMGFLETQKEYYDRLKEIASFSKAKDVCDQLVSFKLREIKEVKSLMDGMDLVL